MFFILFDILGTTRLISIYNQQYFLNGSFDNDKYGPNSFSVSPPSLLSVPIRTFITIQTLTNNTGVRKILFCLTKTFKNRIKPCFSNKKYPVTIIQIVNNIYIYYCENSFNWIFKVESQNFLDPVLAKP